VGNKNIATKEISESALDPETTTKLIIEVKEVSFAGKPLEVFKQAVAMQ
jgi:hypothetical protein